MQSSRMGQLQNYVSYELYKACAHMFFQNYNLDDIVMTSNYPG
jgi:hypothetical protein